MSRWLLLLLVAAAPAFASVGDRSQAYVSCVRSCVDQECPRVLSMPLRLTLWSCDDDCRYSCMHNLTDQATDSSTTFQHKARSLPGLPPDRVVQFHGKWPFYRFAGIQEPLSVLFSLMNLYMHVKYGLLSFKRRLPHDFPRPLTRAYNMLPLAGINLWIWSSVFHTRDKPWTERLDYFSAALSMMCNLYIAIIRIGGFYPRQGQPSAQYENSIRIKIVSALSLIFLAHVSYLTFIHFDYGYNMAFNVGIGLVHNLLWISWSIYQRLLPASEARTLHARAGSATRAPHWYKPSLVLTLLSSLIALELLDFPPFFRALDAHALWHLSTIPVIKLWYDVLVEDAWWLVGRHEQYLESSRTYSAGKLSSREA